jgi:hypothetical protein
MTTNLTLSPRARRSARSLIALKEAEPGPIKRASCLTKPSSETT